MERICRICLQAGADLPIFQEDSKEQSVVLKIYECLHDELKDDEGYPRNICTMCNSTLDAMHKFIETYKENARWLKDTVELKFKLNEHEDTHELYLEEDALSVTSESDLTLAKIKIENNSDFDHEDQIESFENVILADRKTNVSVDTVIKKEKKKKRITANVETEPKEKLKQEGFDRFDSEIKIENLENTILFDKINCQKITVKKVIKRENRNKRTIQTAVVKSKKKQNKKSVKNNVKKTNCIASSILEGSFCWSDMKWSYGNRVEPPKFVPKTRRDKVEVIKKTIPKKERPKIDTHRLCDLCGVVYQDQHKLNIHKKTKHQSVPLKCEEPGCKKICTTERSMQYHRARKHSTKRDFVCAVCSKSFALQKDLTHHMRLHKEDYVIKRKRYPCSICEKHFSSNKCVEIHERSAHTGDRPAVCTVCGSAFFHDDYLKEHMRLHTGETPFHCPVCGRGYAQRGNMKSHMKQHRLSELDSETRAKMKPNYLKLLKC